ncbi:MAG: helix-turn-helix domain-containing protein [Planctomycetota bacterium]
MSDLDPALADALGDLPPILTIAQAAAALGVCRRTVGRYMAFGLLPARKMSPGRSGPVRIARHDLAALLARGA